MRGVILAPDACARLSSTECDAAAERDAALAERDAARAERDALRIECDALRVELTAALTVREKDRQRLKVLKSQLAIKEDEERLEDAKRSAASRRWRVSSVPAMVGAVICAIFFPPAVLGLCGIGSAGLFFSVAGCGFGGSMPAPPPSNHITKATRVTKTHLSLLVA